MNQKERAYQRHLYNYLKAPIVLPNFIVWGLREMDIMTISGSGYISEYEIKTSRSDYARDFREKTFKHTTMRNFFNGDRSNWGHRIANRFWFVTPPGLARDVRGYAGLIEVDLETGAIEVIQKAPLLHREKATPKQLTKVCNAMMGYYWDAWKKRGNELTDDLPTENTESSS